MTEWDSSAENPRPFYAIPTRAPSPRQLDVRLTVMRQRHRRPAHIRVTDRRQEPDPGHAPPLPLDESFHIRTPILCVLSVRVVGTRDHCSFWGVPAARHVGIAIMSRTGRGAVDLVGRAAVAMSWTSCSAPATGSSSAGSQRQPSAAFSLVAAPALTTTSVQKSTAAPSYRRPIGSVSPRQCSTVRWPRWTAFGRRS